MSKSILTVADLTIGFETQFGHVPALHNISLNLNAGEILGIVGESGSGKTVACRSILRLLPKTAKILSGRIMFEGADILKFRSEDLADVRGKKIAMIFQDPATHLDPLMKIGDQIGEALQFHSGIKADRRRIRCIELLNDVKIQNPKRWVDAYPHELSGGMKQRVMIASALACKPKVLIADEPTTALDVTVQKQILKLLKQLREEHALSIILVSHDLGVIGETCDRIVVMKNGRVVETGSTSDIVERPQADYTKLLISSQPELLLRRSARDAGIDTEDFKPQEENTASGILEIKNLSVYFKKPPGMIAWLRRQGGDVVKAVDDISIRIRQGESLGVVGESGSGKSTVARAIVRLLELESGQILFKGRDVTHKGERALRPYRRLVQMVFQDPYTSLNPRLTVAQALSEPLRIYKVCPPTGIRKRVNSLLQSVELPIELAGRRPNQLSGGQRQRVGIARALSLNPEVIIADEITSSLDVTIQAQIIELFKKLRERLHLTIIFISHDLSVVRILCETVLVMKKGRMVEYGPTDRVFEEPQESYTRELLNAVPRVFQT